MVPRDIAVIEDIKYSAGVFTSTEMGVGYWEADILEALVNLC